MCFIFHLSHYDMSMQLSHKLMFFEVRNWDADSLFVIIIFFLESFDWLWWNLFGYWFCFPDNEYQMPLVRRSCIFYIDFTQRHVKTCRHLNLNSINLRVKLIIIKVKVCCVCVVRHLNVHCNTYDISSGN